MVAIPATALVLGVSLRGCVWLQEIGHGKAAAFYSRVSAQEDDSAYELELAALREISAA